MKKGRSQLEMFMRKLGDVLGFKFRFHRRKAERNVRCWFCKPNNLPRMWSFEWWKPDEEHLASAFTVPNDSVHCKTKDDAIKCVMSNPEFISSVFGCSVSSYEQLCCLLDSHCI